MKIKNVTRNYTNKYLKNIIIKDKIVLRSNNDKLNKLLKYLNIQRIEILYDIFSNVNFSKYSRLFNKNKLYDVDEILNILETDFVDNKIVNELFIMNNGQYKTRKHFEDFLVKYDINIKILNFPCKYICELKSSMSENDFYIKLINTYSEDFLHLKDKFIYLKKINMHYKFKIKLDDNLQEGDTSLEEIPKDIEYLDLSNQKLTSFDLKLHNLKHLILYNNNLTSYESLPNLIFLDISCNELTSFICNKNLEELLIYNNKLINIKCNNNLKKINLFENKIENFISNQNLLELDISNNQLTSFQPNKNLIKLNIYHNNISTFICNENLKELDISNNKLKTITLNNNLTYLNANNNLLSSFNYEILSLERLNISCNNLTYFNPKSKLKYLYIHSNNLTHFKPNEDLEELNIDGNQLTEFVCNDKLRILYINNNKLNTLIPNKNLTFAKYYDNDFKEKCVINRRKIYLLAESSLKGGTRNGLAESPLKGPCEYICRKCNRKVNTKLNYRNIKILNRILTYETCC